METLRSLWSSSLRPGRHAFDMEEFDLKDVVHLHSGKWYLHLRTKTVLKPAQDDARQTRHTDDNTHARKRQRQGFGPAHHGAGAEATVEHARQYEHQRH